MTTTAKTLEQLQAEAAAAAEALREAERAAAEAKREAERELRRKADEERQQQIDLVRAAAMAPVIAALHAAGVPAKPSDNGANFTVPTAEGGWREVCGSATMESISSGYYSHARSTGRVLIELSGTTNDDRRRFPPIKAGGHNVAKIIATVQEWLQQSQARVATAKAAAAKLQTSAKLARQVRIDNGYKADDEHGPIVGSYTYSYAKGGGRHEYRTATASQGKVFVKVGTLELTPEQTKIMIDALQAIEALRQAAKAAA